MIITIALLSILSSPLAAQESCVACHKTLHQTTTLHHNFKDWETSAHGKAAVACQLCHGGNPNSAAKEGAHTGILPASDAKSPVYFTNIPRTCGNCHAAELNAFKLSLHFKELERTGRGPNCVTCHGSMANRVIEPRDMEQTCRLCHRKPTQAYAARLSVEEARAALRLLDGEISEAKAGGKMETAGAEKSYRDLAERTRAALVEWHSFKTADVFQKARAVAQEASAAYTKLRLKNRKP